ncbi:hypothetical protein MWU65_16290 [Cellulophaga sp. F20128]|uniref:hypothetical protein n=1 Tax=Cellulophaga sp. F20128 TaxID=2926413 RepID=UPI001FF553D1|nr:hypothetical protein [Cellulophaga sp. F20128]MCK0158753.1 hypothetical protein [Cellulophaga sp. F20128]
MKQTVVLQKLTDITRKWPYSFLKASLKQEMLLKPTSYTNPKMVYRKYLIVP